MPRPLVAQETGRTETAAFGKEAISNSNFNTDCQRPQTIFSVLPIGEANAISSKELAALVGAASVRDLQNRIAQEREAGALILSTCRHGGGYFKPSKGPDGQAEIAAFIATLRARALNTLRALRAAKAAVSASDLAGQIDMDELGVV